MENTQKMHSRARRGLSDLFPLDEDEQVENRKRHKREEEISTLLHKTETTHKNWNNITPRKTGQAHYF